MLRSLSTVAAVSGPLIIIGYLAGSTAQTWTASRGQHHGGDPMVDPDLIVSAEDHEPIGGSPSPSPTITVEIVTTLAAATLSWRVIELVSPGGVASAIATYSPQVLTVWQSVALWTGLAAIVGHVGPLWTRFRRGGNGLASALALLAVYSPVMLLVSFAGLFAGMAVRRSPNNSIPVALGAVVIAQWLSWWFDLPWGWGMVNGPELALWITITATVLFNRWLKGDMIA